MNVLITGISGSGGSYLAEYLTKSLGLDVHGISRWHSDSKNRNLDNTKAHIHECDLTDLSSVLRVLDIVQPSYVFHIASHANVRSSFHNPISVMNNNINGTINLFEAIRLTKLNPFIQLCSTSEVYGQVDPKNVPINEDCPFNPASPYAVSKLTQDMLGLMYFKLGMKIIRTRMFSYINPRREDLFSTSFAKQIVLIEKGIKNNALLHGNLDSVRTIIDVRDAMESYWLAATLGIPGEVYNIGGTETVTVGEFLEIIKSKSNVKINSQVDESLLRPSDVTLQIPNTDKFTKLTGWKPKYTLDQSVDFLLEHFRCQN